MKLTMDTVAVAERFGEERALTMFRDAGFDGVDYSFFDFSHSKDVLSGDAQANAAHTKALLDGLGLVCDQTHAPFSRAPFDPDSETFRRITRSFDYSARLGAKICVVHAPVYDDDDANAAFYESLRPYARRAGIKIGVENLFKRGLPGQYFPRFGTPGTLRRIVERLGTDDFTACFDVGHAVLTGNDPADFLRKAGPLVGALHVQDTDGYGDRHTVPYLTYEKVVDWQDVAHALAEIGYKGNFDLEVPYFLFRLPDDVFFDGMVFAAAVGRHLIGLVEKAAEKGEIS